MFCDAFLAEIPDYDGGLRPAAEGLWVAAVVIYGRAFNTGVRHAERPDLSILTPEERELHDHVLALRNKHFAHSVNGYEDSVTFAFLSANPFLAKRVTRVGQSHLTLYTADPELVSGLRSVAIRFERTLNLRVREVHRQIGDELAGLDIDDIYRMPDLSIETPDPSQVNRRR